MVIQKRLVWAGIIVAVWQFLGCTKISEPTEQTANATGTVAFQTQHRKVYQHSVIPGGVYSPEELARARRIDTVVAEHYSDFAENARVTQLTEDELVYISYRKENKVYWSKKKHRVCKGEAVVTDGKNMARSRCGNRLSKTPKFPTGKTEPTETALNSPEPPHGVPDAHTGGPAEPNGLAGPGYDPGAGTGPGAHAQTGAGDSPAPLVATGATGATKGLAEPAGLFPANSPAFSAGPLVGPSVVTPGTGSGGTGAGGGTTTTPGGGGTTTPVTPITPITATPEPASLLLVAAGGLALWSRRRHKS